VCIFLNEIYYKHLSIIRV